MGLFSRLFSGLKFKPNFFKTEYDNWVDFLGNGGTSEEWEFLKKKNSWHFKDDPTEIYLKCEKEIRPIFDKYSKLLEKIDKQWSILYNSKDYTSDLALKIEKECYEAIDYYKEMQKIDLKYNQAPLTGSKVFTKLPLLYERQGKFEESIKACKIACSLGVNESGRTARMIKKAGREASVDELELINRYSQSAKLESPPIESKKITYEEKTGRRSIPAETIDQMQRIEASDAYKNKIYKMFYKRYPEKPYISQDRELNTNWLEQAEMFPKQCIVPKSMMKKFSDGLLPGHVYMLYWIKEIHRKRIPSYFEYKYGINFTEEQAFLQKNGYLSQEMKLTDKGNEAISLHYDIITNHK